MFYLYMLCDDDNVLFLGSKALAVVGGDTYLDEAWYESPMNATQFVGPADAIEYACTNHPDVADKLMVMDADEARGYL